MPLVINTNVASINAQRLLTMNTNVLQKNMERLASGYRINKAADDAAGLQLSESLRTQIRGIYQAINNGQDGLNMLAIVEGTFSVVQENLQRIRELAVQAANDTNGVDQRNALKDEIDARISDINRIAAATQYNGKSLLNNAAAASFNLHIGPNNNATNDVINIGSVLISMTYTRLASNFGSVTINTASTARRFMGYVDAALKNLGNRRAKLGTYQNRLDSAVANLSVARENYNSAESRIRNVDVAAEAASLTRNQILQQASATILAQANAAPQLALTLLRGG